MKWFDIQNKAGRTAKVYIYNQIGAYGIRARDFIRELSAIKAAHIDLHINSPGGSVFDGQAIYSSLKNHPAKVTTYIDGLAASIASIIALAGDTVYMPDNALLMIHNPSGGVLGEAKDMQKTAAILDKIRETLIAVYVAKTKKTRPAIIKMMDDETWFTAAEAKKHGFIDTVTKPVEIAATFDASHFKGAPADLADRVKKFTADNEGPTGLERYKAAVETQHAKQSSKSVRPVFNPTLNAAGEPQAISELRESSITEPGFLVLAIRRGWAADKAAGVPAHQSQAVLAAENFDRLVDAGSNMQILAELACRGELRGVGRATLAAFYDANL